MGEGEVEARRGDIQHDGEVEDILVKEETCDKRSDMKEEMLAERLNILMVTTDKKINFEEKKTKLKERRVELAATSEYSKMLTMRMDKLDSNAAMIVCAVRHKMMKRLAVEMEATEKEAAGKESTGEDEPETD